MDLTKDQPLSEPRPTRLTEAQTRRLCKPADTASHLLENKFRYSSTLRMKPTALVQGTTRQYAALA